MNTHNQFSQSFGTADHRYSANIQTNQLGEVVIALINNHTRESITISTDNLGEVIKALQNIRRVLKVPTARSEHQEKMREKYPKAYTRWLPEDEAMLQREFTIGKSIRQLSTLLQRNPSAIQSRLRTMGLMAEVQDINEPQWNTTRDNSLIDSYIEGISIEELAGRFKVSSQEIEQRLTKLAVL